MDYSTLPLLPSPYAKSGLNPAINNWCPIYEESIIPKQELEWGSIVSKYDYYTPEKEVIAEQSLVTKYANRPSEETIARIAEFRLSSSKIILPSHHHDMRMVLPDPLFANPEIGSIRSGKYYAHQLVRALCHQYNYGFFVSLERVKNDPDFEFVDILTFDNFLRRWLHQRSGPFIICEDTFKDFKADGLPVSRPSNPKADVMMTAQYELLCFKQLMMFDLMRCCRILSTGASTSQCLIVNQFGEMEMKEIANSFFTGLNMSVFHELLHPDCLEDDEKKRTSKPWRMSLNGHDGLGDFVHYLQIHQTMNSTSHRIQFEFYCNSIYAALGGREHQRKYEVAYAAVTCSPEELDHDAEERRISNQAAAAWYDIRTSSRKASMIELFSIDYKKANLQLIQRSALHVYRFLQPGVCVTPGFTPNPIGVAEYAGFIRNYICGGASSIDAIKCSFINVMSILKFALVTGEKPMQAIILKGERGSGKSNFCQWIATIFGRENTGMLSMSRLGQQFNSYLSKRLIIFDETNLDSKTADGRQSHTSRERCNAFKELVTGLSHLIEPKGKEAYYVESSALVIACQDNEAVLPEESLHRRIVFAETYKIKVKEQTTFFQQTLEQLNDPYVLQNLVAYLCADSEQIAEWNTHLEPRNQILELPSIAEIRAQLGRLANPYADQGLGSEVDVRVAEHAATGKLCFEEGLMFVKDHSFRDGQDPGCFFMHTEGLMRMWYLSMADSGCTPAQIAQTIGNEYIEIDGKLSRNPNFFTFDERKHKNLLKWMSMLSIQDEQGYFLHPNLDKKTRIQARRLEKWGLHQAMQCKGEFFFRFSSEWSQAFGRLLTKPPGQEYPKFIQGDFSIMLLHADDTESPLSISDIKEVSFGGKESKVKPRAHRAILNEIREAEAKRVETFIPSPLFN